MTLVMTDTMDGTRAAGLRPASLGFGLGFRQHHYADLLGGIPGVDWLELISENFFNARSVRLLDQLRALYPVVLHGVSLSIASTTPLDMEYLATLKALAAHTDPAFVSDHLCWTGVHGTNLHDLLPIPYTRDALDHVADRVHRVQEILGRSLTLENVSSYIRFEQSEMSESEFLAELTRRTGCWLLCDIGNIHVTTFNHGEDPLAFIDGLPADRVVQFHLAGHSDAGTHLIDTHDQPIAENVWALYEAALRRFGSVSVLIERDDDAPIGAMVVELDRSRRIAHATLGRPAIVP